MSGFFILSENLPPRRFHAYKRRAIHMHLIKYKFANGTTIEIEVTDKLYNIHLELLQQEKHNHWKETRRHSSLHYFMENRNT